MEMYEPLDIIWFGPVDDISGIANVNRNMIFAMQDMGLRVRCEPAIAQWSHLKANLPKDKVHRLNEAKQIGGFATKRFIAIWSVPPHYLYNLEPNARANISYSLFESDNIPLAWVNKLNQEGLAECWVPCKFQIDAYRKGGIVPSKMKKLPMGVDLEMYKPEGLKMKFPIEDNVFKFLTVMDVSYRKYPELLLRAYCEEFKNDKDVVLIFKGYTGAADQGSRQYIKDMIAKAKKDANSEAKVFFISGFLEEEQFPNLHRAADVYVNSSRGEGWSLPVLQSMACGVPVIMPKHSSHLEFGTNDNALWVDCDEIEVTDRKFLSDDPRFLGHRWWEPKLESMKKQMRWAYEHRPELAAIGTKAQASVQKFSWHETVRKMCGLTAKFCDRSECNI